MTGIQGGAVRQSATTGPEPLFWRPGSVILAALLVLAFEYAVRLATFGMLDGITNVPLWEGAWQISNMLTLTVSLAVFLPLARRKDVRLHESLSVYPGSRKGMWLAAVLPFTYLLPAAGAILYFFPEARSAPGEFMDWRTPFASALILAGIVIGPVGAAIFSSIAFALSHFDKDIGGLAAMVALGLLLCYVAYRSGTIVYGLIAHMVNNAILIAVDAARSLL
jgi:membrane protease YdiL (CAAX protease family)